MNAILDMSKYEEQDGLLFYPLVSIVNEALDGECGPMDERYLDLMFAATGEYRDDAAILRAAMNFVEACCWVEKRLQSEAPNC